MSGSRTGLKCAAVVLGFALLGGCAQRPQMEPTCSGSIPLVGANAQAQAVAVQPKPVVKRASAKKVYSKKKARTTARKAVRRAPVKRKVTRVARPAPVPAATPPIPLPLEPVMTQDAGVPTHHIPDRLQ